MTQSFLFETDPEPVATVPGYPSVFSACRKYRYCLWRIWRNVAAPRFVLWCLCNPSTADDDDLDPTLRRCRDFSAAWDYDAMCIVNLFGFRATDPEVMKQADDAIGDEADAWIARIATDANLILCAWGCDGRFQRRDESVRVLLNAIGKEVHCLKLNSDGTPLHPLYSKSTLTPTCWPFVPKTGHETLESEDDDR